MPPPKVRPASPVCVTIPAGTASPKACVSRSSSPRSAPAWALAVRASGSTRMPFMRPRSMTIPPSQSESPGKLCPPPLTATGRLVSRANRTAEMTSELVEGGFVQLGLGDGGTQLIAPRPERRPRFSHRPADRDNVVPGPEDLGRPSPFAGDGRPPKDAAPGSPPEPGVQHDTPDSGTRFRVGGVVHAFAED